MSIEIDTDIIGSIGSSDDNQITFENLQDNINIHVNAIELCLKKVLLLPGLILIYSGIDIMAWLYRPENQPDVQRQDFIEWTEEFLLPGSGLSCDAIDLYSARCSLVHSNIPKSKLTREGRAKQLGYAYGPAKVSDLQKIIDDSGKSSTDVAVHIDSLFEAFTKAIGNYMNFLSENPEKADIVLTHAKSYYSNFLTY